MEYPYDISIDEMEQIELFLSGQLPAEAAGSFASKMENDELWRKKVEEVKWLQLGLGEALLQEELEAYHTLLLSSKTMGETGRRVSLSRKLAIAASIVALVSISLWWYFNRESRSEKLYSSYYLPDPGLITSMGTNENYDFEKAMVEYKNKEYEKAIEAWSALLVNKPSSDTLHYFLGAAYQAKGNSESAIRELEKVASNERSVFYKESCWYLGLSLLKKGEKEKAIFYIERSRRPQSKELLMRINKK